MVIGHRRDDKNAKLKIFLLPVRGRQEKSIAILYFGLNLGLFCIFVSSGTLYLRSIGLFTFRPLNGK